MAEDISRSIKIRMTVVSVIIYILLVVFSVRLAYLQILKGSLFKTKSFQNQTRSLRVPSYRSILYDRNKDLKLAYNERSLALLMIQANIPADPTEREALLVRIADTLNETPESLYTTISEQYIDPYTPIVLKSQVTPETLALFAERLEDFPGIFWENRPNRVYPYHEAGFHIVGYTGIMSKEEFSVHGNREEYYLGSSIGKRGIEKIYDQDIRGKSGILLRSVDVQGRVLHQNVSREPVQGEHIVLTVDARLQQKAEELMRGFVGSVVVTEIATGEILTMLSTPSVNPSIFSPNAIEQKGRFYELSTNALKPFLNRSVQGNYSPASTFKLVSAAAFLKAGVDANKKVVCSGSYPIGNRIFRCTSVHGPVNMKEAIGHSCNSYFYQFSQIVGHKAIIEMAQAFGVTDITQID
ncbi:MAG: penicillin-binding transpeptidase domain-containing protein, partial [Brevinema sp.]